MSKKHIIKFKSMQEILLKEPSAHFDEHGNLRVSTILNGHDSLAPSYFNNLGQLREFKDETSFPHWCIEWSSVDVFNLQMTLRQLQAMPIGEDALDMVNAALKGRLIIRGNKGEL